MISSSQAPVSLVVKLVISLYFSENFVPYHLHFIFQYLLSFNHHNFFSSSVLMTLIKYIDQNNYAVGTEGSVAPISAFATGRYRDLVLGSFSVHFLLCDVLVLIR